MDIQRASSLVPCGPVDKLCRSVDIPEMTEETHRPWLDNVVTVDDIGITDWHSNQPVFSIRWSEVETVSVDVDPFVSGPHPCEGFWLIAGNANCLRLPLSGKPGVDDLNLRLLRPPGFDQQALRRALEAEAAGKGGAFLCWRR
jgi:hypothetical protein